MAELVSKEIRLKNRPVGLPGESDFELAEVAIGEVGDGEVLVQNIYMSVDPYMRGRMYDRKSYVPPFQLDQPLDGGCVGRVVESKNEKYKAGDFVFGMLGWREYFISDGTGLMAIDPKIAPVQAFLGTVGMPGLTAYYGLLEIGQPKAGETVFVSAASGAVGAIVCQIAKIKGCYVVGSAGSDEKVSWLLEEAGVDAAFNYKKTDDIIAEVGKKCPKGIDVYYENVGGVHLEAALEHMNKFGRIVMCGMIDMYNATDPVPGPPNLAYIIGKQLTMQGFIVSDHFDMLMQFYADLGKWIGEGKIKWKETVIEGIENAPRAFIGLFKGENFGKMLVKIGD
ncbi:NADP-dependent oxidoreductase [Alkalispirochaeta odontotermitis]|nr:NADP-dependent oxidoreductase [Alkalispirochaeta odontotermitis]CAB1080135.1 Putative oxidoreductase YncB [Olavius algarvensis Delta 1 endosymbiont]